MSNDLYNNDWIDIDGNLIHKTAIVHPNVKLGKGNVIGAYCVIGGNGEIRGKNPDEFRGTVHIGNNNVISEHVTIQRPFEKGKSTIIGNDNLIMAHVHIGHDAYIGNGCEICTSSVIGGYVTIYDKAKIKLHCVIRNRLIIGSEAVVGMGSVVTKSVPNFAVVYGNPAKQKGIDVLGEEGKFTTIGKLRVFWKKLFGHNKKSGFPVHKKPPSTPEKTEITQEGKHPSIGGKRLMHVSGITGIFSHQHKPTGKPLTVTIITDDGRKFFAPAHEFTEI